ncbi:MAG TPA: transcription-repair coupling factor, partial [Caulobacteraceae bacterium]|nr:transcription-repair coupling factor [Caulobacteraceae bacterium]
MSNPQDLKRIASAPGRLDLVGAPEGFDALAVADILKQRAKDKIIAPVVFVARDTPRAQAFTEALGFFAKEIEALRLPGWDCLPYDRIGPSPSMAAGRMATLSRLAHPDLGKPVQILVTTVPALLQRSPPRKVLTSASYLTRVGHDVKVPDLERYFAVNGYVRASTVSERGEFAIRGGVIDVFAPGTEEPVRLDLFGDSLESIRAFDPETQRSTRQLSSIDLLPVSEVLLDEAGISRFRKGYVGEFGAPGDDSLYASVSAGQRRAGVEHWLPLFYETLETLFDYLPDDALYVFDHLAGEAAQERMALIQDAYEARTDTSKARGGYKALAPETLYQTTEEWAERIGAHANRWLTPFQREGEGVVDLGARIGRSFTPERAQDSAKLFEAAGEHATALAQGGKRVLFASWSDGASERLGV